MRVVRIQSIRLSGTQGDLPSPEDGTTAVARIAVNLDERLRIVDRSDCGFVLPLAPGYPHFRSFERRSMRTGKQKLQLFRTDPNTSEFRFKVDCRWNGDLKLELIGESSLKMCINSTFVRTQHPRTRKSWRPGKIAKSDGRKRSSEMRTLAAQKMQTRTIGDRKTLRSNTLTLPFVTTLG
jgi:hypothetical protein